MPESAKITPRLDAAVDSLRRERVEHDRHVARETDVMAQAYQTRFNRLEGLIAESLAKLEQKMDANTHLTGEILLQTTKTNGRVGALETSVRELRDDTSTLKTDRTRALQTIAILTVIGGIFWMLAGDEIKRRGVLNPTPAEIETAAEAVIERRITPNSIKPKP